MSDPRPPAAPPPLPETVTGEWPSGAEPAPAPDSPTVTASGTTAVAREFGIPNPFGRYAVTRLLGRGGMGAVFLAQDTALDRPVALKIPVFGGTLTAGQKERFFREARAISALRHPNLCPVFDVDEEQGIVYLTMAYIDGQPLSALIQRGPVEPGKAVELVRRVARAMHEAHIHGTIHRDLKPANILIDKSGEPVVMDFGLARRATWGEDSKTDGPAKPVDAGLTQFGSVLGTPAYMPPEQARGDVSQIGPRSDVYALGVILYELLTGRRPFTATEPADLIRQIESDPPPRPTDFYPWIDKALEASCLKALAKDPADRFGTMAEFERNLKEAVEPELKVVLPPPLPKPAKAEKPKPKKRWWVKVAGCLGIATLFLVVCVGGPAAAVVWIINSVTDKVKGLSDSQSQADTEWNAILSMWPAPAADARPDTILPPTFDNGKYRRVRDDTDVTDTELGITLAGRRGVYSGPDGEVEVRVYRCPEAQAKAIQQKVVGIARALQAQGSAAQPGSKRKKAVYFAENGGNRTVTFGFHDEFAQNQEYGKLWYGGGWLFWFRTAQPLVIEWFPSKFLLEVGKRAESPK
jgi:serine/threonine protein kinase